jgi:ppGpp synthetase/RelA/SpoT-type nucleotidyltranferase
MKLSKIKKIINKEIIESVISIMKKLNSFKEKIMKKGKEVAEAF